MDMNRQIGANIRRYRLARNLTLDVLASAIHKSRSTLSKYECGSVGMDVSSLLEISAALNIPPARLLSNDQPNLSAAKNGPDILLARKYLYLYDGRARRIFHSVLEYFSADDPALTAVTLFYDVDDISNPESCKAFYQGSVETHDLLFGYSLINQHNPAERVLIYCANSLGRKDMHAGILMGLSNKTMLPTAAKVMLSDTPLEDSPQLLEALKISGDDLRLTKQMNMFTMQQFNP